MARGRVGGTHSRISGKVGDEVYIVQKKADGSYFQVVQALPETREDVLTPEKCRQRCYMSVIMSHMPLLTDFMSAAFDGIPNGTLSVQEFVRLNVKTIQQEIDGDSLYGRGWWYRLYGENVVYPEPLYLTTGNFDLPQVSYAVNHSLIGGYAEWDSADAFATDTIRKWQDRWKFHSGDYLIFMFFICAGGGKPARYVHARLTWREGIDLDALVKDYNPDELFKIETIFPLTMNWHWSWDSNVNNIRFRSSADSMWYWCAAHGSIAFGFLNGKRVISRSRMFVIGLSSSAPVERRTFEEVWPSWYEERL